MCVYGSLSQQTESIMVAFLHTMQQQSRRVKPVSHLSVSFISGQYVILAGHYSMKIVYSNSLLSSDIDRRQMNLDRIQIDKAHAVSVSKDVFHRGLCLGPSSYPPG